MRDWLAGVVGESLAPIATVIVAAVVVILLALVLIGLAKRIFAGTGGIGNRTRAPRLAILDVTPVDPKRKLVLVRRDEIEHLILIGGQNDLVIEQGILRGQSVRRPRADQAAMRQEPDFERDAEPSRAPSPPMPQRRVPQVPSAAPLPVQPQPQQPSAPAFPVRPAAAPGPAVRAPEVAPPVRATAPAPSLESADLRMQPGHRAPEGPVADAPPPVARTEKPSESTPRAQQEAPVIPPMASEALRRREPIAPNTPPVSAPVPPSRPPVIEMPPIEAPSPPIAPPQREPQPVAERPAPAQQPQRPVERPSAQPPLGRESPVHPAPTDEMRARSAPAEPEPRAPSQPSSGAVASTPSPLNGPTPVTAPPQPLPPVSATVAPPVSAPPRPAATAPVQPRSMATPTLPVAPSPTPAAPTSTPARSLWAAAPTVTVSAIESDDEGRRRSGEEPSASPPAPSNAGGTQTPAAEAIRMPPMRSTPVERDDDRQPVAPPPLTPPVEPEARQPLSVRSFATTIQSRRAPTPAPVPERPVSEALPAPAQERETRQEADTVRQVDHDGPYPAERAEGKPQPVEPLPAPPPARELTLEEEMERLLHDFTIDVSERR